MSQDEKTGIVYKKWHCQNTKAVFLLVHGLGAYSGRWKFFADFFLKNDITSYAIELKGFGETEGLKGHVDSLDIYYNDIQSLYEIVKRENPGKKVIIVGESMGGLICFSLAAFKPDLFDGLICISPAFKSRMKFSLLDYIKVFIFRIINPKKQLKMPFNSQMCTRDVDIQKAMDTDPREHRLVTPKLLLNIALTEIHVLSLIDKIKTPSLFLVAGDYDKLTDPQAAKLVFKTLKIEAKQLIEYPEMYHSLSVELGREKVFEDILNWVNKRI